MAVTPKDYVGHKACSILAPDALCDGTLILDDEGVTMTFRFHRLVLASVSPLLRRQLYSKPVGSEVLRLRNVKPAVVKALLLYACNQTWEPNETQVAPLLRLAKEYEVLGLVALLGDYMTEGIDDDNCLTRLDTVVEHPTLVNANIAITEYICQHAERILLRAEIALISPKAAKVIFSQDSLAADEMTIFNAALRFAAGCCNRKTAKGLSASAKEQENVAPATATKESYDKPKPESLRRVLLQSGVLHQIRFTNMDMAKFSNTVIPTSILSENEVIGIFRHKVGENPPGLLFNTNSRKRPDATTGLALHGNQTYDVFFQEKKLGTYKLVVQPGGSSGAFSGSKPAHSVKLVELKQRNTRCETR